MNYFFYHFFLFFGYACLFLCLYSCEKGDIDPPEIQLIAPQNNSQYNTMQALPIQLSITDDHQLFSYTINIHANDTSLQMAWDTTFQRNIVGQQTDVELQLTPPVDVPNSQYTLSAFALDRLQRPSDTIQVVFQLRNHLDSLPPNLSIDSPSTSGTVTVFSGGTLLLIGDATDNTALKDLKLYLQPTALAFNYPNHTPVAYYNLTGQNAKELVYVISVPEQEGYYSLRMVLRDQYNNITNKTVLLKVL